MRIGFLIGFGLLPLWAALAFIAIAFATTRSDHAGMSLWALVVAIPACAVTLLIAGAGSVVHSRTAGDAKRKQRFSVGFVSLACLGLVASGVWYALNRQKNEQILQHEQGLVLRFVQESAVIRNAAGEPLQVSSSSYTIGNSGPLPVNYDVQVKGTRTIYAIVGIDRTTRPTTFRLLCTTPLYSGQRDPSKGACEQ